MYLSSSENVSGNFFSGAKRWLSPVISAFNNFFICSGTCDWKKYNALIQNCNYKQIFSTVSQGLCIRQLQLCNFMNMYALKNR